VISMYILERSSRAGKSGCYNGAGHTGWDKRLHEEGYFAYLSSPISGKTEVTRELDYTSPPPISKAGRHPRSMGKESAS
jgi:hypothetical protein